MGIYFYKLQHFKVLEIASKTQIAEQNYNILRTLTDNNKLKSELSSAFSKSPNFGQSFSKAELTKLVNLLQAIEKLDAKEQATNKAEIYSNIKRAIAIDWRTNLYNLIKYESFGLEQISKNLDAIKMYYEDVVSSPMSNRKIQSLNPQRLYNYCEDLIKFHNADFSEQTIKNYIQEQTEMKITAKNIYW